MMIELLAASVVFFLAAVPAVVFFANLRQYRPPPEPHAEDPIPAVSVLIPARNEEAGIGDAVEAALASQDVHVEVIVLDDHSEDATAALVRRIAAGDSRVRLETAAALPPGWCGKQHACAQLARRASYPLLAFLDADVRLEPRGLARAIAFLKTSEADLISGVPRQITGTFAESLLIPLIHFILLGFLPLSRMRASTHPAYGAGCGQLFLTRREAYERVGGHAAIRDTLHDGIRLPRAFRAAARKTDLFDATGIATCRMYRGFRETWHGLAKNATEGLASPGKILPATVVLGGGQVLPVVLLASFLWGSLAPSAGALSAAAFACSLLPRLVGAVRFRQSILGALFHPLGVLLLLAIQWHAFFRQCSGRPVAWRGRAYGATMQRADCREPAENTDCPVRGGSLDRCGSFAEGAGVD